MHELSERLMERVLRRAPWRDARVLDVGSLDVNGSFRTLIEGKGWQYFGLDIQPGPNVDVATSEFDYPFPCGTFDVVISGCTMEHVTAVWRWLDELARVLEPGGFLALITHTQFSEHRYPVDCWRILPDGMRFLFDNTESLERYVIRTEGTDIVGSAFKKGG